MHARMCKQVEYFSLNCWQTKKNQRIKVVTVCCRKRTQLHRRCRCRSRAIFVPQKFDRILFSVVFLTWIVAIVSSHAAITNCNGKPSKERNKPHFAIQCNRISFNFFANTFSSFFNRFQCIKLRKMTTTKEKCQYRHWWTCCSANSGWIGWLTCSVRRCWKIVKQILYRPFSTAVNIWRNQFLQICPILRQCK